MYNYTKVYGYMADFGEDVPIYDTEIFDKSIDL